MPDRRFNNKSHFRFTQDEVAEMESLLKENNNIRLPSKDVKALALKFSKTRQLQGLSCVRSDSVHNWFTRRRHIINSSRKGLSSVKSSKPSILSSVAKMQELPVQLKEGTNNDNEEASHESNSDEESSGGGDFREGTSGLVIPSSSVSNSVDGRVDRMDMDVLPKPVPFVQSSGFDIESVLARLAKFQKAPPEDSKTFLDQKPFRTPSSGESGIDTVDQAKAILGKLEGISLVDFKRYQKDFDMAICVLVEKGSFSDTKKAELMLLQERLFQISKENDKAREGLSQCDDFQEKLTETAESVNKLIKKADLLEQKYKSFPQDMSAASHKVAELEAALVCAKAELEIMKGDRAEVINKLVELSESLESVNKDMMSLKAEEAHMMEKRVKTEEALEKNTGEWVRLTHLKGFTVI